MPDTPNGLASLTQARENKRTRRTMPAPRHPVVPDVSSAELAEPAAAEAIPAAVSVLLASQDVRTAAKPRVVVEPAPEENSVGERVTRPSTVYLDETQVEFLEQARIAGLTAKPRLDISKSAVVRLALRRLQADMSINDIRNLLGAQPTAPDKTGRKRR